jgi:glycosyltransferase involved in cell wall biosynthesis
LDKNGIYCHGQTAPEICQACLASQPDFSHINITDFRWEHQSFIDDARFIIAPSQWAKDQFSSYFAHTDYRVIPHGMVADIGKADQSSMLQIPDDNRFNIGVLGAVGPVKGARQLEQLVQRTRERELPLRWVVIGFMDNQFESFQSDDAIFNVHGSYDPRHLQSLMDHYKINLVVFPSAGPESYCYTLSESWQAGRPVLVPPIGALNERVLASGAGWLMSDWQNTDAILNDILPIVSTADSTAYKSKQSKAVGVRLQTIPKMAEANESVYRHYIEPVNNGATEHVNKILTNTYLYETLLLGMGMRQAEDRQTVDKHESGQDSTGLDNLQSSASKDSPARVSRWLSHQIAKLRR